MSHRHDVGPKTSVRHRHDLENQRTRPVSDQRHYIEHPMIQQDMKRKQYTEQRTIEKILSIN